jgi:hypothetical protein
MDSSRHLVLGMRGLMDTLMSLGFSKSVEFDTNYLYYKVVDGVAEN